MMKQLPLHWKKEEAEASEEPTRIPVPRGSDEVDNPERHYMWGVMNRFGKVLCMSTLEEAKIFYNRLSTAKLVWKVIPWIHPYGQELDTLDVIESKESES